MSSTRKMTILGRFVVNGSLHRRQQRQYHRGDCEDELFHLLFFPSSAETSRFLRITISESFFCGFPGVLRPWVMFGVGKPPQCKLKSPHPTSSASMYTIFGLSAAKAGPLRTSKGQPRKQIKHLRLR